MEISLTETTKRGLAVEGALLLLISYLLEQGNLSPDKARGMVTMISQSSDLSKEKTEDLLRVIERFEAYQNSQS
jgi:hypothetical protein